MSGARTGMAGENIAAGTKTGTQTFHLWQSSPGHNANLLQPKADIAGLPSPITSRPATRRTGPW